LHAAHTIFAAAAAGAAMRRHARGFSELLGPNSIPSHGRRRLQAEASSQELTSAGLLNLLHRRLGALGGDAAGRALAERLLAAAAGPYFEILGKWLAEGVLDDPYNEFMVKASAPEEGRLLGWLAGVCRWPMGCGASGVAGGGCFGGRACLCVGSGVAQEGARCGEAVLLGGPGALFVSKVSLLGAATRGGGRWHVLPAYDQRSSKARSPHDAAAPARRRTPAWAATLWATTSS
jgi:hypothetical protein